MKWAAWAAGLIALLAFAGCGGGESQETAESTAPAERTAPSEPPTHRSAERTTGGSEKQAGTPSARSAEKPPTPTSSAPESTEPAAEETDSWKEIGQQACRGMAPLEAALHFKASARAAGAEKRFIELVTEPSQAVEQSPGYPRLVAALYSTTLPASQRAAAASGCAEELAAHG